MQMRVEYGARVHVLVKIENIVAFNTHMIVRNTNGVPGHICRPL